MQYEILVVDGTETPIERAKKSRKDFFQEKKETYNKNISIALLITVQKGHKKEESTA
ncbi:transposase [Wolbachia endosymbiont of Armadillidium vulgare str. wVulC]|nr:hypothetical protein [Wolbachia endosymbiont of Armadillidium vulgare]KLT22243.1 transposase [Wolbachia endosymbiont of Armadillidium vulgare str. wVulC]OJH32178.1 hypothetical protein Wxf_01603 [Wolbachia endosymbiont of Armadillidium vulgare]OJH33025.1 hypothetical protein Wxf_02491 [Wolbachia endosymbiont of Armadillidium vulgare]